MTKKRNGILSKIHGALFQQGSTILVPLQPKNTKKKEHVFVLLLKDSKVPYIYSGALAKCLSLCMEPEADLTAARHRYFSYFSLRCSEIKTGVFWILLSPTLPYSD